MKTYSLYPVLRVDKPNKNGTCSLYIRYTYGKVWKNISLNKTLEPSYWNKEENEPRKNCPNRKEILDLIRRKKTEIETIVLELSREDGEYPSPEELINNISNGKNRNIKNWVYYFDLFVKNQTENLNVEPSTLEVYRQSKEKLNGFQTEKNISFLWKNININFYNQFVYYLRGKGLKDGTIGKHIKTLKSFLNYVSIEYNLLNPNQYRGFTTLREEPDFVILNDKDLELMKSSLSLSFVLPNDFVLNNRERVIVKIMILLCKTGMNFCDLMDLKVDDIFIDEDFGKLDHKQFKKKIETGEIRINLFIKKVRKKIKRVDKKQIPIIPITHEIGDLLKYFFIEWENVTSEEINRNFKNIIVPNEDESLYTLWNLIDFIKDKYVRYGIEDVVYYFPNYPYFLPQKISNVSFNKEIKQVLKKIGLIYNVKVVNKTSKNKIEELVRPKYELITSRTGRRTNITSSLSKGINDTFVMRTHGIKKSETLRRYENIPDKEIIEQLREKNPIPVKPKGQNKTKKK